MNIAKNSVGKTICKILSIVLVGVFMLSGSILWATAQDTEAEDFNIYLAQTTFDPAQYVRSTRAGWPVDTSEQASKAGLYLGPTQRAGSGRMEAGIGGGAGAQLGSDIPPSMHSSPNSTRPR